MLVELYTKTRSYFTNYRKFNPRMVNPQPKSLVKNIVVTLVARPSLVQEILKPMYEAILVRNRTNATAVIRSLPTSRLSILT